MCNKEKIDSYKGLEKVDGTGEGSEVKITEISIMTQVCMCLKALRHWKWVKHGCSKQSGI